MLITRQHVLLVDGDWVGGRKRSGRSEVGRERQRRNGRRRRERRRRRDGRRLHSSTANRTTSDTARERRGQEKSGTGDRERRRRGDRGRRRSRCGKRHRGSRHRGSNRSRRRPGQGSASTRESLQLRANYPAKDSEGQGRAANLDASHFSANCSNKLGALLGGAASSSTTAGSGREAGERIGRRGTVGRSGGGRWTAGGEGDESGTTTTGGGDGSGVSTAGERHSGSTCSTGLLPSLSSRRYCIRVSCVPFEYARHRQPRTGSNTRCIKPKCCSRSSFRKWSSRPCCGGKVATAWLVANGAAVGERKTGPAGDSAGEAGGERASPGSRRRRRRRQSDPWWRQRGMVLVEESHEAARK